MYKIFSVDDHIVEPANLWSTRVPAKFRDQAPHVVEQGGREFWLYEDQRLLTMGLNAVAGRPRSEWGMEPAKFTDMIPGCFDPKDRARDLLSQGVLASINFPTIPRFGGMLFNTFKDKELASHCVRAWNDFVLDEWCPGGPPGMFVPMTICQVWDPMLAADEIARCVDLGSRALCFVENPVPSGLPGFHTDTWDPIWAAAQDADLPVCMHIGSSGLVLNPDPDASWASSVTVGNVSGILALVNLLISDVFERFPKLQIVYSEAGIGWLPSVLERADRQFDRHAFHQGVVRTHKPSEVFERNMHVCMVEEPVGMSLYELIGAHKILAETDYPHADTTYPKVQEAFEEVFAGIPQDVVEMVSHKNAERLFKWEMCDEALMDSPDVKAWRQTLEADEHAALKEVRTPPGIEQLTGDAETEFVMRGGLWTSKETAAAN